jgi:hypothetical protein
VFETKNQLRTCVRMTCSTNLHSRDGSFDVNRLKDSSDKSVVMFPDLLRQGALGRVHDVRVTLNLNSQPRRKLNVLGVALDHVVAYVAPEDSLDGLNSQPRRKLNVLGVALDHVVAYVASEDSLDVLKQAVYCVRHSYGKCLGNIMNTHAEFNQCLFIL